MQHKNRVLIVGSGGREHAFTWKISLSNKVDQIFVAPGNAGTSQEHKTTNIDISPNDIPALIQFSKDEQINLLLKVLIVLVLQQQLLNWRGLKIIQKLSCINTKYQLLITVALKI